MANSKHVLLVGTCGIIVLMMLLASPPTDVDETLPDYWGSKERRPQADAAPAPTTTTRSQTKSSSATRRQTSFLDEVMNPSPPTAGHSNNPHIIDIELTQEQSSSPEAHRHAVHKMRSMCEAGIPGLQQAPWTTRRGISTMYNDQTYLFQNGLVCYDDRTKWYYDGERSAQIAAQQNGVGNNGVNSASYSSPRNMQEAMNRAAFEMKPTAKFHSLFNNTDFSDAFKRTMAEHKFHFHQSLGILSVGAWGTVSIYHFMMDLLMGMTSLIMSNPELEVFPRDVVQMHENHIMKIEKWNLPPCFECLAVAPIVTDNLHQPNITISYTGPVDGSMRCFCGMVLVHHQTLTNRAPCCSRPMTTQTHVGDVMMWMKQRLVEKWNFRPFGKLVQYEDYAKYGYWVNSTNPRKPRLLFLLRTKSRYIAHKEDLMQVARDLGFAVHSMAFETETMERQMAAGRYADVVLGTHGAALTSLVMMDTSGDRMLCRSLIEMFHWAPLGRIVHYQKMAYMVNVSALGVIPVDVLFGKSVANPKKERKLLKSFSYTWSGTGFHDQTSFYNVNTFRERLVEAIRNLKNCRDVDLSDMKVPPT
ncbi:membrane-associated protein, putative [Bodo saltans]|uniref:Membrane-associated protein, putative n=1 Tax=Bodo saltans TaxID=75058 RepID=A0A0S4IY38_BODSA|nr:membrane-associated protein, putative [Bodo saltans]|eukprot:CUG08171.1 membrane-associated protein, putative [Bodo saltans]